MSQLSKSGQSCQVSQSVSKSVSQLVSQLVSQSVSQSVCQSSQLVSKLVSLVSQSAIHLYTVIQLNESANNKLTYLVNSINLDQNIMCNIKMTMVLSLLSLLAAI